MNILFWHTKTEHFTGFECAGAEEYIAEITRLGLGNVCFGPVGCLENIWPSGNCTAPRSLGDGPGLMFVNSIVNLIALLFTYVFMRSFDLDDGKCVVWSFSLVFNGYRALNWILGYDSSYTVTQIASPDDATVEIVNLFAKRSAGIILFVLLFQWIKKLEQKDQESRDKQMEEKEYSSDEEESQRENECDNCEEEMSCTCRFCEKKCCPECAEVEFNVGSEGYCHKEPRICYMRIRGGIGVLDRLQALLEKFIARYGTAYGE